MVMTRALFVPLSRQLQNENIDEGVYLQHDLYIQLERTIEKTQN